DFRGCLGPIKRGLYISHAGIPIKTIAPTFLFAARAKAPGERLARNGTLVFQEVRDINPQFFRNCAQRLYARAKSGSILQAPDRLYGDTHAPRKSFLSQLCPQPQSADPCPFQGALSLVSHAARPFC